MLAIAIISLIGFAAGVLYDLTSDPDNGPKPRLAICSIMVISWWDISLTTAIVFLCLAGIYLIINLIYYIDR